MQDSFDEDRSVWKGDNLSTAHSEVTKAARWARQVGMNNVAPRLEYAARLIAEEINKTHKTEQAQ
jgi:hypothetical protein